MTKINITISDQERSFSATVDSTVEDIIQSVDAALQAMGWNYNTIRNTIYELYREKRIKLIIQDNVKQSKYSPNKTT